MANSYPFNVSHNPDITGKHPGAAFLIVAKGPSAKLVHGKRPAPGTVTIGVNDSWNEMETDYVCIMDPPACFMTHRYKRNRMSVIQKAKPPLGWIIRWKLVNEWTKRAGIQGPILRQCHHWVGMVEGNRYYTTALTAGFVASTMGAKAIGFIGVDLKGHYRLADKHILPGVLEGFDELRAKFPKVRLLNLSPDSLLTNIPRGDLDEFLRAPLQCGSAAMGPESKGGAA